MCLRDRLVVNLGIHVQQALMRTENLVQTECIAVHAERLEIRYVVRRIGHGIDEYARIAGRLDSFGYCGHRVGGADNV
jgi:methionine aminopeptidase